MTNVASLRCSKSHSERDPVSQARCPYCDSKGGNDISENRSGLSTASSKVQTTKGTCDQLPPGDEGTSAYEEVKIYLRNKVWMLVFKHLLYTRHIRDYI